MCAILSVTQAGNISIQIVDVLGKTIQPVYIGRLQLGDNSYTANLSNLAQGVYMYQVKIDDTVTHVKFIKE